MTRLRPFGPLERGGSKYRPRYYYISRPLINAENGIYIEAVKLGSYRPRDLSWSVSIPGLAMILITRGRGSREGASGLNILEGNKRGIGP